MGVRRSLDDYAEMMTLLPEGNRQIATAIGHWVRTFATRVWQAMKRTDDHPILP